MAMAAMRQPRVVFPGGTTGLTSLFLCLFLHMVVPAARAAPLWLPGKEPSQTKEELRVPGDEKPKDSACPWNTGLFYQMTCWAAIWPARDILFRITGPGSMPGSALGAGMTEVEPVCSDSPDLSAATTLEPQLLVASPVPLQEGFQRT